MTSSVPLKSALKQKKKVNLWNEIQSNYLTWKFAKSIVFDPAQLSWISFIIIFAELFLNIFIVENVKYTEIDWIAYMQEVGGFLNGTLDYSQLKGKIKFYKIF
jgi:alpha-1,3-mannosyltransferase